MWHTLHTRWIFWRSPYSAALKEIPDTLYDAWRLRAKHDFPGIPQDAVFFARAAEGLMRFFACVGDSRSACALPSKAADSVWHVWIGHDEVGLKAMCRRHFGLSVPHVEGKRMGQMLAPALARTFVWSRRQRGTRGPVPALFALDARLRMPDGYGYGRHDDWIGMRNLGRNGKPEGPWIVPEGLLPAALLATNLISVAELEAWKRTAATDGASCGSSFSLDGGDSDGGGGDCGGASCGGGCGGGD